MFKKLSDLENQMRSVMQSIIQCDIHTFLNNLEENESIALYECFKSNFIENIDCYLDANGNYHFSSLGHTHINKSGLKFIKDMSTSHRVKNAIFDLLKGTIGFILGIATTVIGQVIISLLI